MTISAMASMPNALFHTSPAQRVALARQRYFDEGILPSGIVSEAILESWSRCVRTHRDPHRRVEFDTVTNSRSHLALQRNRPLLAAWEGERSRLEATLASTSCAAMLTDASGVIVAATCAGRSHERILPVATRVGVNLCEEAVGTTAPGVVAKTGRAVSVIGGEHYFEGVQPMQCAASPIRNLQGQLVGVLDISSEHLPFQFDALAVVSVYAAAIENRLLSAQAEDQLVLRLQVCASMIDTPMVGMAGIDAEGRLSWVNEVASRLLGTGAARAGAVQPCVDEIFGVGMAQLMSLPAEGALPLSLANGLTLMARAQAPRRDGLRNFMLPLPAVPSVQQHQDLERTETPSAPEAGADAPAMTPPKGPASLRDSSHELVLAALQACGGNVSKAARHLRVSRGLIYRRLQEAGQS